MIGALMTHSASRWLRTGRPARPASCSRRRPCPTQCACAATSSAAQRRRRRRRHACQHRRDTVSTEGTAARGPRRRRARARWRAPAAAVHAHAHDPAPGLLRTFAAPALRPPKPRSRFTFRKETMETSFFAVVFVLHYDFAKCRTRRARCLETSRRRCRRRPRRGSPSSLFTASLSASRRPTPRGRRSASHQEGETRLTAGP